MCFWISPWQACYTILAMTRGKQLTMEQQEKFAEKFMEWGNLVFAGLVVAQTFPGRRAPRPWPGRATPLALVAWSASLATQADG